MNVLASLKARVSELLWGNGRRTGFVSPGAPHPYIRILSDIKLCHVTFLLDLNLNTGFTVGNLDFFL